MLSDSRCRDPLPDPVENLETPPHLSRGSFFVRHNAEKQLLSFRFGSKADGLK